MKNVLFLAILVFFSVSVLSQTQLENNEKNSGNVSIIQDADGKCIVIPQTDQCEVLSPVGTENNSSRQKEKANEQNGRTMHHLTINFDQTMFSVGAYIYITSNTDWFTRGDLTWSEDGYIAEIDLLENSYEIISWYDVNYGEETPKYVLINELNMVSDTGININFETMASHTISLPLLDENGEVIDTFGANVLLTIDIELPLNHAIAASINQITIPNGCIRVSDIFPGYKIILSQLMAKNKYLHIADMGQVENLWNDTILNNNYLDYKKMDMVFHSTPESSGDNHLVFRYGTAFNVNGVPDLVIAIGFGYDGSYPSFDKDTLHVFMDNRPLEISENKILTCVATAAFYDEANKSICSNPFFVNDNDSIAFAKFNVSATTPQFADNSIVNIGNEAPIYRIYFYNETNAITAFCNSIGQVEENRVIDKYSSVIDISNEEGVLLFDYLSNFTGTLDIDEPGAYSLDIMNHNYSIESQNGEYSIENDFNTCYDPNPPTLSSLKLLNGDNSITSSFESDEQGTLMFSAYDYQTGGLMSPSSVQTWYKKYEDEDWTELNVAEHPEHFDYLDKGSCYKSDLSPALAQFSVEGYLDLKIVIADVAGNSSSHTWHPVAYVRNNTVGIREISQSHTNSEFQVYPNPVTNVLTVEYFGNETYRINILNSIGNMVYTSPVSDKKSGSIDLKPLNLSDGVYLIQLVSNSKRIAKKIIFRN